jgi:hypothetical protein
MSSHESPGAPGSEELRFDRAEYATPGAATTCVACKNAVSGTYYEINGKVLCPRCRDAVEAHRRGGSGVARFTRAAVFGSAAAFAGFLIYYGVMKLAHMEIGLISVLVGFMVGVGVRNGSRHRGGWLYQWLALVLTYSAIAASYSATALPILLVQAREKGVGGPVPEIVGPAAKNEGAAAKNEGDAKPDAADPGPAAVPPPAPRTDVGAAPRAERLEAPTLARAVVALGLILALFSALPVLVGFRQPIGLLIVAFALWEAWKLNKRVPLVINGPFEVATTPAREAVSSGSSSKCIGPVLVLYRGPALR